MAKKRPVVSQTFNLMDVAIGSTHYDYSLGSPNKFQGKLIFDVRMAQRLTVQLQIGSLECNFNEPLTSKKYFYNYIITVGSPGQQNDRRKRQLQNLHQPEPGRRPLRREGGAPGLHAHRHGLQRGRVGGLRSPRPLPPFCPAAKRARFS